MSDDFRYLNVDPFIGQPDEESTLRFVLAYTNMNLEIAVWSLTNGKVEMARAHAGLAISALKTRDGYIEKTGPLCESVVEALENPNITPVQTLNEGIHDIILVIEQMSGIDSMAPIGNA
jgi:hypothetical protein